VSNLPVDIPGMTWLCRMCNRLAEAHSLGGTSCGVVDCGGPMQGKGFPRYSGPVSTVLLKYCFSCGADAEASMAAESGDKLGVCMRCLKSVFNFDVPKQEKS